MSDTIAASSKLCTKCGIVKSAEEFSRSSRNKSGLRSECKACVHLHYTNNKEHINATCKAYVEAHRNKIKEYQDQYRIENNSKIRAQQATYRQNNKEKKKEADKKYNKENRPRIRATAQKWRDRNREKARSYQRAWRLRNLDSERSRAREYWARNKDRRRINKQQRRAYEFNAPGFHTIEDIKTIYSQQEGKCYYCDTVVLWNDRHDDHKTPLSRGGSNWPDNIVCTCASCNLSKNNKTAEEFFDYLKQKRG